MEIVTEKSTIIGSIPKVTLVEVFPDDKIDINGLEDERIVLLERIKKIVTANVPLPARELANEISKHTGYKPLWVSLTLRLLWRSGLIRMFLDPGPNRRRVRLKKEVAYYLIHNLQNYKIEYQKERTRAKPLNQQDAEWVKENKGKLSIIEMARRLNTSEWYIKKALYGK